MRPVVAEDADLQHGNQSAQVAAILHGTMAFSERPLGIDDKAKS